MKQNDSLVRAHAIFHNYLYKPQCMGMRIEHGETVQQALQREILEETKLCITNMNDCELLFADTKLVNQYIQNVYLFYLVPTESFTPQLSNEHSQYKCIPIGNIPDFISFSVDQIDKLKKKIL